jgi:hypothetical protein
MSLQELNPEEREALSEKLVDIFYIGHYCQILILVISTLTLIWALISYREAKSDKISKVALILFEICFILNLISSFIRLEDDSGFWGLVITSVMGPFTFAVTMTILYFFIFELVRIRFMFNLSDEK